MEGKIISAAISDRSSFEQIELVDGFSALSDKGKILYTEVKEYYENDHNARRADPEILLARIVRKHPKHEELFTTIIRALPEVSAGNVTKEVMDLKLEDVQNKLSTAFSMGNKDQIEELLEQFYGLTSTEDEATETAITYNNMDAEVIGQSTSAENCIRLSPKELNDAVEGRTLRGHHLLFFARPDVGKTTMAGELVAGFLEQGLRVMYVGNEDPPVDIMRKFMSRITEKPWSFIEQHFNKANAVLAKRNWGNFYFIEMTPGTPKEIRSKVHEIRPDVLIVDQSINIRMGISSSVEQLGAVERFLRNIGKQYRMLTISFAQAGDSGDGQLFLTMGDLYGSNTAMQASADLMVGIGMDNRAETEGFRMLSFPKNKIGRGSKEPKRVNINWTYFKVGS